MSWCSTGSSPERLDAVVLEERCSLPSYASIFSAVFQRGKLGILGLFCGVRFKPVDASPIDGIQRGNFVPRTSLGGSAVQIYPECTLEWGELSFQTETCRSNRLFQSVCGAR